MLNIKASSSAHNSSQTIPRTPFLFVNPTSPIISMSQLPVEDSEYYILTGDLHILVDNVRYRVHSYFFTRDSSKFRELLVVPAGPNQTRLGSAENPICIANSTPAEFAKFLWIFYNKTYSDYNATSDEWISILKLACEYDFAQVKDLAIRGLDGMNLSTVERLCIYQLYRVGPSHIVPLLAELCVRNEGPTDEETERLGIKTSLVIFRARENLRSHIPADVDHGIAVSTVCSLIGVDPSHMQNSASTTGPNGPGDKRKKSSTANGAPGGSSSSTTKPRQ